MARADLLRECTEDSVSEIQKQKPSHCGFWTFALINMQSDAFLTKCAIYREGKCKYICKVIYSAWKRLAGARIACAFNTFARRMQSTCCYLKKYNAKEKRRNASKTVFITCINLFGMLVHLWAILQKKVLYDISPESYFKVNNTYNSMQERM